MEPYWPKCWWLLNCCCFYSVLALFFPLTPHPPDTRILSVCANFPFSHLLLLKLTALSLFSRPLDSSFKSVFYQLSFVKDCFWEIAIFQLAVMDVFCFIFIVRNFWECILESFFCHGSNLSDLEKIDRSLVYLIQLHLPFYFIFKLFQMILTLIWELHELGLTWVKYLETWWLDWDFDKLRAW
jgi:hypothetical protein